VINDEATRWLGEELAPDPSYVGEAMKEVTEKLIAAGWTPPPRVFLEGDEIPCHLAVINNYGEVNADHTDYEEGDGEVYTANYDVVEFNVDWEAAIERERERRGVPNPRAHLAEED
jgi:hypothetical protein